MRATRRGSGLIGLIAALLSLVLPSPAAAGVRESAFVARATGPFQATTSCYDRAEWVGLVDSGHPELKGQEGGVYGLWLYDLRQVALPARGCDALEQWRHARASVVSTWIFVLGHELTHVQQSDLYDAPWSRPFDELEADCGGDAKFARIVHDLGITRQLPPPPWFLSSCPAKKATLRR
jgi:hypothetical protein